MNLPNALTLLRLLLVPVFAALYLTGSVRLALVVYVAAALTDALDGFLARKLNQITSFGKLFDPLADKLMQLTMLICLATTGHVAWVYIGILLLKELYMVVGAAVLFRRKIVIQANILGKIATLTGVAAILCIYPWHAIAPLTTAGQWLLALSLIFSVCAAITYTLDALRQIKTPPANAT